MPHAQLGSRASDVSTHLANSLILRGFWVAGKYRQLNSIKT